MGHTRFDNLARSLAQPASRRGALGVVVGGALALLDASTGTAKRRHRRGKGAQPAGGGNSQCARFCAAVFGADTAAAGQCTSDAAHGKGLCHQCGAANASTVCCQRTSANTCPNYPAATCCPDGQTCTQGACQPTICSPAEGCARPGAYPYIVNCPQTTSCAEVQNVDGGCVCVQRACGQPCSMGSDCPSGVCMRIPGCCSLDRDAFCATPCATDGAAAPATTRHTTRTGWQR